MPDRLAYPEKLTDLRTDDRGVRLSLSVRPYETNLTAWQGSLEILATISTKTLNVHREVEHRWANITPILFAFYSDDIAIATKSDSFGELGGTNYLVELAEPSHPHTWRLYLISVSVSARKKALNARRRRDAGRR
ncbi:MAG: hypothetical protein ACQESR_30630 [Planctomycetota bacterium]